MDPRAQQLKELLADRFELVEFLGKGGFASVYRVRSLRLGRFEALKVLHKSADDDPEFGRRFRQEAMLAAALDHPSIVKIYDFGEVGGLFWYSMQLVDGPTLSRELRSRGRLPAAEAARLAIPVLDALEYSHQKGVIHRDVKPENIILDRDRRPYLMDFGIAKAEEGVVKTKTGFILGSPSYLSPEQLQGKPLDGRTDVYAMGVTLYEMLSGTVPFEGPDRVEVLTRRLKEEAEAVGRRVAGLPPELERIVTRSVIRDRDQRYASARELRDALVAFVGGTAELSLPVPVPPPPSPAPTLQGATRKLVEVPTKPVTAKEEVEEVPTLIERAPEATRPEATPAVAPTVSTEGPRGVVKGWMIGAVVGAVALAAGFAWLHLTPESAPEAAPAPAATAVPGPSGPSPSGPSPPIPTPIEFAPTSPPAEPTPRVPGPSGGAPPTAAAIPLAAAVVEAPPPTRAPRPVIASSQPPPTAAPRRGAPVTPMDYEALEPFGIPDDLRAYAGRKVGVRVTVGADGSLVAAKVISPLCPACDEIVLRAVRTKFRFTPARDAAGNGVESGAAISVTFGEER